MKKNIDEQWDDLLKFIEFNVNRGYNVYSNMSDIAELIYSIEIQKDMSEEQVELFLQENGIEEKAEVDYVKEIFVGIKENKEEIVSLIQNNLKEKWSVDRISKIDLAILEVAIFELVFSKLPYKVVINEAVELAKKYGDDNSKAFVNGILASIVKEKKLAEEE